MSMPIQRQSESFGYFDEGPRYARDHTSTELPAGLAALINTSGPRITGGMLNTRTAVNVDGMDPESHAYHTELPYGPGPGREWNPDFREYEPSDEDERRSELVGEDDDSGFNWGPEPYDPHFDGPSEHAPDYGVEDPSFGEYDKPLNDWEHETESRQASRHPFDRTAGGGSHVVPWEQNDEGWHNPGTNMSIRPSEDAPDHWQMWAPGATMSRDRPSESRLYEPNPDPQALMDWHDYQQGGPAPSWHETPHRIWDNMFPPGKLGFAAPPVPGASSYLPGHRVGLDWRDKTIPGTVIGLDGPHVAVRWDDSQHSSEEPHNIHLL